jgi:hypothetical protein
VEIGVKHFVVDSVADPGCLSRIQKQQQKRGRKKFIVIPFYIATNFIKFNISFEMQKKKI